MNQEPLTLYKLIVLYLLNKVSFPLTMAQVGDLILEKEYTSYLTLQQVINELAQAGLITAKTLVNRTHLQITEEGRNTLSYFENRISDAIKTDIGEYLKKMNWKCATNLRSRATIIRLSTGNSKQS